MGRVGTYKNCSPVNPLVQSHHMFDAQSLHAGGQCLQVSVYNWSIGPQGREEDEGDPET